MIQFTVETDIERPVPEVFAYATDPDKLSTWQTNTVSAVQEGDGPLGLGTRLREVHRGPGGKELESLVEVSEYAPDSRFGLRMIEGPLPVHALLGFEHLDGGTRLFFTVHGQPTGAMRFAQPLLRIALRRQFREHCANLKRVLEERPAA
ncbi:MAG TPA: SRPBCC family protein [Solirubrobacterales bacterium]|nr:SRPBCC family protein [Solirubrobacterales bacterium]